VKCSEEKEDVGSASGTVGLSVRGRTEREPVGESGVPDTRPLAVRWSL